MVAYPIAGYSLFIAGYTVNGIALIHQFKNKRANVNSKASWSFLMLIAPLTGALIYLLSGWVLPANSKYVEAINNLESELFPSIENTEEYTSLNPLFAQNALEQHRAPLKDSKFDIYEDGDKVFPKILEDIKHAKSFIYVESFIINDGIIWQKVSEELINAYNRGVIVRILTDYVGNLQTNDASYLKVKESGIPFVIFNKVSIPFSNGYANYRNHNKFIIVDNNVAWMGGLNIGDDYGHLYSKYGTWNDVQFRSEGSVVNEMKKQFMIDWFRATEENITEEFSNLKPHTHHIGLTTQMVVDGPHLEKTTFLNNLIKLIDESKKTIRLISPYMVLPYNLERALVKAHERGVNVEIITTGRADKKTAYFVGKFYVERLRGFGIKVYRTEEIFNHAKMYMFDDELSIIGTSNLDYRAIYLHWETNFLNQSVEFNTKLNNYFERTLKNSYLETTTFADWSIFKKGLYLLAKLFSPML